MPSQCSSVARMASQVDVRHGQHAGDHRAAFRAGCRHCALGVAGAAPLAERLPAPDEAGPALQRVAKREPGHVAAVGPVDEPAGCLEGAIVAAEEAAELGGVARPAEVLQEKGIEEGAAVLVGEAQEAANPHADHRGADGMPHWLALGHVEGVRQRSDNVRQANSGIGCVRSGGPDQSQARRRARPAVRSNGAPCRAAGGGAEALARASAGRRATPPAGSAWLGRRRSGRAGLRTCSPYRARGMPGDREPPEGVAAGSFARQILLPRIPTGAVHVTATG